MQRRPTRWLLAFAVVVLALSGAATAQAAGTQTSTTTPTTAAQPQSTPTGRAAAIAGPSIAYLEMDWTAYVMTDTIGEIGPVEWATRCSGFFANPDGYVVTAGHCLDDGVNGAKDDAIWQATLMLANEGLITEADIPDVYQYGKYYWTVSGTNAGSNPDRQVWVQHGVAASGVKTGEAWGARVLEVRDVNNGDVALAKVETTDMPMLTMAPEGSIDIGTPVVSIGYPGANDEVTDPTYTPSYKDGTINQKTTMGSGSTPVYQTSADLSGGMSGGPTVNEKGEVVGINVRTKNQGLNYIAPSSVVQEVLSRNGVDNTLTQTDITYREGVEAYYAGDYSTAVSKFDAVLQQVPAHSQAQEMRKEATAKVASQPSTTAPGTSGGGGSSNTTLFVIIGAVVLLAGGFFLFMRSRGKKAPTAAPAGAFASPAAPPTYAPPAAPQAYATPAAPQAYATPAAPPAAPEVLPPHPEVLVQSDAPPLAARKAGDLPDVVQFCSHCGAHIEGASEFCSHCGTALHGAPHEHGQTT